MMSARWIGLAALLALLLASPLRAEMESDGVPAPQSETAPGEPGGAELSEGVLFPDFEPLPDRWRIKTPPYPGVNVEGHWWDPYNTNTLKGDRPLPGMQEIFGKVTLASKTLVEGRAFPIASGVSTAEPGQETFFGSPDSILVDQKFAFRGEILKGATSYKPFDWQILVEGVADVNSLNVWERGVVSPDVREGTDWLFGDVALEQAFLEVHLADISANYDFISIKLGRQPFASDFRALIFQDVNQGVRLFGTAAAQRIQFNLWYSYQAEKDIVSELNTFDLRNQQIAIANVYLQDFFFNGWTNEFSFHFNFDDGVKDGLTFDRLGFLVRPTALGDPRPHNVTSYYLGWASEGHIGRLNLSTAFYQALGRDDFNGIAGREVDINGQLAFVEASVDIDWIRPILSVYFTSGDDNPRDGHARGFDSILDNPKVVGGEFSWFQRQSVRITDRGGAGLNQRLSLIPDLRSNKLQGQANFVNPGVLIVNAGTELEVTPKLRFLANANYIRFVETEVLEQILGQSSIDENAGVDLSTGIEWRPWLNNNVIVKAFGAVFQPLDGFRNIYGSETLWQGGLELILVY